MITGVLLFVFEFVDDELLDDDPEFELVLEMKLGLFVVVWVITIGS